MKVSIVTISFNQKQFLQDCLDSVDKQTYKNYEHIIVDPGSSDGSRELVGNYMKYSSLNKAVTVFEKDQGPADGLNKGFEVAQGDIYYFLNADDYLFDEFVLERIVTQFQKDKELDMIFAPGYIVDKNGRLGRGIFPSRLRKIPIAYKTATIFQQGWFFTAGLYDMTKGFNLQNSTSWDAELVGDLLLNSPKIKRVNFPTACFRLYEESITGSGQGINRLDENGENIYLKDGQRIFEKIVGKPNFRANFLIVFVLKVLKYVLDPVFIFYTLKINLIDKAVLKKRMQL